MKDVLYVERRATNDNGDIEDVETSPAAQLATDALKPCAQRDWLWRKRPILSKFVETKGGDMKAEL